MLHVHCMRSPYPFCVLLPIACNNNVQFDVVAGIGVKAKPQAASWLTDELTASLPSFLASCALDAGLPFISIEVKVK